jgi:hypothetical protein
MRRFDVRTLWWACLAVLASLCVLAAFVQDARAQVLYGSLVGSVRDQTRAAIPGADVTIVHRETGRARTGISNDLGNFDFASIPTGAYEVRVGMAGFKSFVRADVAVSLNSVTRVDVVLEVGEVSEQVTVTGRAAMLQTESAEVKSEISDAKLVNLPIPLGRNWQFLVSTLPGVGIARDAHSIPSNPSRALQFSVQGTSESSIDIRIDGSSGFNVWLPHITSYVPALESIETVNVVTNSFDAEQGLAGGAAINVQIKSGTNDFHGSAFAYNSNNAMMATPFFTPAGERNPKYINNQFGATLGGPIKRDRVFFFASYEGTRERAFASALRTIPSMEMRRGDLSRSDRAVYDPFTGNANASGRVAFPGNIIPPERISPTARKILDLLPVPTYPNEEVNNYYAAGKFEFDRDTLDTKVDWRVTNQFNMYGRLSLLRYDMVGPTDYGELGGGTLRGGNPGTGWGGTYSTTIAGTYVFKPTFLLDGHFGYNRQDTSTEQLGLDQNIGRDFLGIPGTNGTRRFEAGWPRFNISGFPAIGYSSVSPYYRRDPQRQGAGNANWTRGKHNIRFGGEVYAQHMNHTQAEGTHPAAGGFNFTSAITTVVGGPSGNNYNSIAAFLLDAPSSLGRSWQVPDEYSTRARFYSLYVRDRWSINPRLTLSIGLRWEYFSVPTRADRGMERYDPVNNTLILCGVGGEPTDCGVKIQKALFAPRVGLAFRATPRFVIRAGYGLTNDPFSPSRPLRFNYPDFLNQEITGAHSRAVAGSMAVGIPAQVAPDMSSGVFSVPNDVATRFLANPFRRGYIQSWNLMLQRELPGGLTAEVGYAATRSIRQLGSLNLNDGMVLGAGQAGQPLFQQFGRTASTSIFGGDTGNARYDSLVLTLQRRFAEGISIDANYTFSKTMGVDGLGSVSTGSPSIKLPEYRYLNWGLSALHMPHKFSVASIFELPFGNGKRWLATGPAGAVLGGWQINGILQSFAGMPYTITAGSGSLNTPGSSQRADQVKATVETFRPSNDAVQAREQVSWFDPFAFAPVDEPRFGTSAFNKMLGPSQFNVDLGIFRKFRLTEEKSLEARLEVMNFSNTPHLGNPGGNRSNLLLNPDGTIRSLAGYTQVTDLRNIGREGIDQRTVRLGLRLGF